MWAVPVSRAAAAKKTHSGSCQNQYKPVLILWTLSFCTCMTFFCISSFHEARPVVLHERQGAPSLFTCSHHWVSFIHSFTHSSVTTHRSSAPLFIPVVPHAAQAQRVKVQIYASTSFKLSRRMTDALKKTIPLRWKTEMNMNAMW